jgi:hypothetical protein
MTLNEMIEDLKHLVDKGRGEEEVEFYCVNCDCSDTYRGATASSSRGGVQITLNGRG